MITDNPVTLSNTKATYKGSTDGRSTGSDEFQPAEKQFSGTNDAERTALFVVAILAAGLVLCLLAMVLLFLWNRRQLR